MMNLNSSESFYSIKLLWLALFLQSLGQALSVFFYGSDIGTTFFLTFDFSEVNSQLVERGLASLIFFAWIFIFFKKKYFLNYYFVFFSFCLSLGNVIQNSNFGAQFSFGAHLIRYCLPIGLIYLSSKKDKGPAVGELFLRWGLAITFIFHGIEAISFHPDFIDYLIEGFQLIFKLRLSESIAKNLLLIIGVIDILVGAMVGARNFRPVFLYMAIWGFLTAVYRPIYHGVDGIIPFIIRSSHYFVPLYFLLAGKVKIILKL